MHIDLIAPIGAIHIPTSSKKTSVYMQSNEPGQKKKTIHDQELPFLFSFAWKNSTHLHFMETEKALKVRKCVIMT